MDGNRVTNPNRTESPVGAAPLLYGTSHPQSTPRATLQSHTPRNLGRDGHVYGLAAEVPRGTAWNSEDQFRPLLWGSEKNFAAGWYPLTGVGSANPRCAQLNPWCGYVSVIMKRGTKRFEAALLAAEAIDGFPETQGDELSSETQVR